jgi:hypothetical protein
VVGKFVESGFPFARVVPRLEVAVELPVGARGIAFDGIATDAVQVWLDGKDLGFAYGPAWRVALPDDATGPHVLTIELIPSTFNFFGPHHHVDGDRHIVSPDQFTGKKNFADRADAPADTRVPEYHFKPARPPTSIRFIA